MTDCTQSEFDFPAVKRRRVQASFDGGAITSDGGALLLREVDRTLGLTAAVARALGDTRRRASCTHDLTTLLRQRIFALALGYEDLNDHQQLRHDVALQTAVDAQQLLGSQSTLCRLENGAGRESAIALHEVLIEQFIASFKHRPKKLVLDFDTTDDAVHGQQVGRSFHGYYDRYCFLPLYVTCRDQVLVSYLRPSRIDGAKHAWAILSLLVKRLRQAWPKVRIVMRADSGFCRHRMLRWCERHDVGYIIGLAKNPRLERQSASLHEAATVQFEASGKKVRCFGEFAYAANTWDRTRRVIARIEVSAKGFNPRFVVSNVSGKAKPLYDKLYCARGEMENRIKEQQLDMFADRTSCHHWWPNQLRLLLSTLAYTLVEALQRLALQGTPLARAYVGTIRLKLLKIGAVVIRNTRRVRLMLSSQYPYQDLFALVVARLQPG